MIFQEPMTSLIRLYGWRSDRRIDHPASASSREQARRRAIDMLPARRHSAPERRIDEYPHQMSGGMPPARMIAMALACNPALLIADEPTTALDVTIQAQILDLCARYRRISRCRSC